MKGAFLTVYDGLDSIGGNKILLESGGIRVFLDFGINFKRHSSLFAEFLQPRPARGVHDLLELGLIPPLPIYREDLTPSDLQLPCDRPLDAVYLSHAHLDHWGCAGLLSLQTTVCCSAMTAAILKGVQDVRRESPGEEVVYLSRREPDEDDSRVLNSSRNRNKPLEGRRVEVPELPPKLQELWKQSPQTRPLNAELSRGSGPLPCKLWEVDHSIPGATAFALETEAGWVVYTGDLRMHGTGGHLTEKFLEEAAGLEPRLLIIEGTRVGRKEERRETEEEVYRNCLEICEGERGLVVADFSPRNFERLETFRRIAEKTGRELAVLPEDAHQLRLIGCVEGRDRLSGLRVYRALKGSRHAWEKNLLEELADRVLDPSEVSRRPSGYILCLSYWNLPNLLDIKPEGGTYLYSSSEVYSEEEVFDFQRLYSWLEHFHMRIVGFKFAGGELEFEPGFHASGHAPPEGLLRAIERIRPKEVLPVHTEHRGWFRREVKGAEVLLPREGEHITLT
jgi:ribonuclease J